MEELNLKNYAHIGDAVWELHIREKTVFETQNISDLHKLTTQKVNAKYQAETLSMIEDILTEAEIELIRRARNLSVPVSRRNQQAEYRQATALEVLVGYLYLTDKERLNQIYLLKGI